MIEQIKSVSGALAVHFPGLLLMTGIHITWAFVLTLVLLAGAALALIAPDRSSGYVWARFAYDPVPVSPKTVTAGESGPDDAEADLSLKEDAHELAGV